MLKILAIEDCKGTFVGYLEDSDVFRRFESGPQQTRFTAEYPKSEYGKYEHFAAILGKFDPYAVFLKESIEVQTLDYKELESVIKSLNLSPERNES